jgi:hypothetical protein
MVKDQYQLFMCIVVYVQNYLTGQSQIRRRQKSMASTNIFPLRPYHGKKIYIRFFTFLLSGPTEIYINLITRQIHLLGCGRGDGARPAQDTEMATKVSEG